jgi:hypothetical protein
MRLTPLTKQKSLVISKLVKFSSLVESTRAMSRSFSRPALPAGGIDTDPTVWLDGAKSPLKYVFKNNMGLTNSKI